MGEIKITDLHKIHGMDHVKDMYQIFDSESGRIKQSMVLTKDELEKLGNEISHVLLGIVVGAGGEE